MPEKCPLEDPKMHGAQCIRVLTSYTMISDITMVCRLKEQLEDTDDAYPELAKLNEKYW